MNVFRIERYRQSSMKKSRWVKIIAVILLIIAAFFIRSALEKKESSGKAEVKSADREVSYAETVDAGHPILRVFKEQYKDAEVLRACEEDVTNDGNKDLVVIYRLQGHTRTVVLVDSGDHTNYNISEPIPAPVENQKIQFKNIDKEAEIEIVITGEKNGAVGYAIYRMVDGEPVDLFGEGMEDCC